MWDVQLQRRAVMNEMRQMAARPFASVEMQLTESEEDKTLVTPVGLMLLIQLFNATFQGMLRSGGRSIRRCSYCSPASASTS